MKNKLPPQIPIRVCWSCGKSCGTPPGSCAMPMPVSTFITDPGLIDAGIYDINALKSRYDFLLRKMKTLQAVP